MLEISEVNYGQYGKCVRICNGKTDLLATLDFGPRIIRFSAIGKENIFFEDVNDCINGAAYEDESFRTFGKEAGIWHIRGGHRLWISPETVPETYYPDNEPVLYEKIKGGIRLLPPPQKVNNLALSIEATMPEENLVHITHKIQNTGNTPVSLAPWALTVLSPGGTEIFPVPTRDTGLCPNRHFVFWPYTKINDSRITRGDKYMSLRQKSDSKESFKLGFLSEHGWAAYFNHGDVFIKHFDTAENSPHTDMNCNFETFTNCHMLEMESIGKFCELLPGESVLHVERWSCHTNVALPRNDEETDAFVKSFIQ